VSQFDPDQFKGMPIAEVIQQARLSADTAKEALAKALQIYRLCARQQVDRYTLGRLREQIWEIEQCSGSNRPFFSAAGQDKYIYENFFKDKQQGIFVEIGGYNGWRGSNCYFFEKTLNWTGIIVEASPGQVKEISKFRNAEIVHAAISDADGTAEFIDMVSGLTQMGGLESTYPEQALATVRNYPGNKEQKVTVPTLRLDSLLRSSELSHVDYCSIDVEGAERTILSVFDTSAFDVTVFSVENNTRGNSRAVRDLLEPAGYKLIEVIGSDEIYYKESG